MFQCAELGAVASIEHNHKAKTEAKKGDEVAIKIENTQEHPRIFGKHFDEKDELYSRLTRESIDVLKECYGTDLSKDDVKLIQKIKQLLKIQ